ncbi:nicotinate-nucleotide adenylyltransferase [Synechococcus sp. RSCCF101]|nr:nicotinate-nucleotide adenylyltransferase [Synechococcus sp. RSCCF101]QEY33559.1 nicotinate-nucleotide adenylyltransferase [Synechococcus sp. RSCCF101]
MEGTGAAGRPPAGADAPRQSLALFGTSADPPTLGHRAFLQGLSERYGLVRTWASDNPLKQHGAPLAIRSALLQAVVTDLNRPGLKLDQRLSSRHTLTSVRRAAELYPGRDLVVVVGSDLLGQIPRWHASEELLQHCSLAVVPRVGWPARQSDLERLRAMGGTVTRLDLTIPATASSSVRARPDPAMVPPELWQRLREQDLYGWGGLDEWSGNGDPAGAGAAESHGR